MLKNRLINLKEFKNLLIEKKNLLGCIFLTLIFQGIITIIFYNKIRNNPKNKYFKEKLETIPGLLLLFVVNISLVTLILLRSLNFYMKFGVFIIFSIIQGLFLGGVLRYINEELINSALYSAVSLFICFYLIGLLVVYFKLDLSGLALFLFSSLLLLIIIRITTFFIPSGQVLNRGLSIIGLIIFSIYIIFNTNNILLKYNNNGYDCIRGALDYYLDIINIFLELLNLKN
jgi:FtsH-binding integral membrane protein